MKGFKDSTRTMKGFGHWNGGSIGGSSVSRATGGTINRLARGGAVDKIDSNPGHAEVYPSNGDRIHGNSATQRVNAPTRELEEHGGKTPLTAGFKKGGSAAKHFHVHKHYHAKGGRAHTVSHSYSAAEKHAETYADGGHVHDSTEIPAGYPDYKRGGKTPVRKNAGGALYAPGGAVSKPAMGGVPLGGTPATGALGRLAARPQGLPVRPALPMRRPMGLPGPQPIMRAKGGDVPMRKIAKEEVRKHVGYPTPKGHKGLGEALKRR